MMMERWLLATLHLLALAIGFGALVARGRALRGALDPGGIKRVLEADNVWGLAAGLWVFSGVLRAFFGYEKGTDFYHHNSMFALKMSLFGLIWLLEVWPMSVLIGWRVRRARGQAIVPRRAALFARVSTIQAFLLVGMVLAATAMARGIGS